MNGDKESEQQKTLLLIERLNCCNSHTDTTINNIINHSRRWGKCRALPRLLFLLIHTDSEHDLFSINTLHTPHLLLSGYITTHTTGALTITEKNHTLLSFKICIPWLISNIIWYMGQEPSHHLSWGSWRDQCCSIWDHMPGFFWPPAVYLSAMGRCGPCSHISTETSIWTTAAQ